MYPETLEVVTHRHNAGIDPHVHIWGWEVPGYLFLGGVVAGIMILVAALELRRPATESRSPSAMLMPFMGIVLLSLGMLLLLMDLAYPTHVLRFYATFEPTSAMSWGSWILLLVYPAMALVGMGSLDEKRRAAVAARVGRLATLVGGAFAFADRHRRAVLWLSLAGGIGLGIYTGLLLGTMVARPLWSTSVLGPLFLVSGISTGAAFMMLFRLSETEHHAFARWDTVAIVVELVLLVVLVFGFLTGDSASTDAGRLLLGGDFTATFWGLVVVGGLLIPLALNLLELRRGIPGTVYAPLLVLAGGLALRAVFVAAGQLSTYTHLGS